MQHILVVAPSWVGDCMLAQPMLARLKQRFPACRIDLFAPPWTVALLQNFPEVDQVIVNPFPHGALNFSARRALGKKLQSNQYDTAIVLPNSLKSALIPFFANIPNRIGFIGEFRYGLLTDARPLDKQRLPLMVERFAYLAEEAGAELAKPVPAPCLQVSADKRANLLNRFSLLTEQPIAIFCPGAEYGEAKRWPIAYFAELAQRLLERGYVVWLIGSPKDHEVSEKIVGLANAQVKNLCGKTDLSDALALLDAASLVVSNDSGLMHLAAALNKPLLALFGSSSPQFTPPLSPNAQVLKLDLPCSPCFKRVCPLGHFNCMMQLTPDMVTEHLNFP
jgi:heptosyltransferase-2